MVDEKYSLKKFSDKRESIVTKIDSNLKFPESMEGNKSKYFDENYRLSKKCFWRRKVYLYFSY